MEATDKMKSWRKIKEQVWENKRAPLVKRNSLLRIEKKKKFEKREINSEMQGDLVTAERERAHTKEVSILVVKLRQG